MKTAYIHSLNSSPFYLCTSYNWTGLRRWIEVQDAPPQRSGHGRHILHATSAYNYNGIKVCSSTRFGGQFFRLSNREAIFIDLSLIPSGSGRMNRFPYVQRWSQDRLTSSISSSRTGSSWLSFWWWSSRWETEQASQEQLTRHRKAKPPFWHAKAPHSVSLRINTVQQTVMLPL